MVVAQSIHVSNLPSYPDSKLISGLLAPCRPVDPREKKKRAAPVDTPKTPTASSSVNRKPGQVGLWGRLFGGFTDGTRRSFSPDELRIVLREAGFFAPGEQEVFEVTFRSRFDVTGGFYLLGFSCISDVLASRFGMTSQAKG